MLSEAEVGRGGAENKKQRKLRVLCASRGEKAFFGTLIFNYKKQRPEPLKLDIVAMFLSSCSTNDQTTRQCSLFVLCERKPDALCEVKNLHKGIFYYLYQQ